MSSKSFNKGIVEGFYGRQWSWPERRDFIDFLAEIELNSYLYCPKGDAYLRKQWTQDWPAEQRRHLRNLAQHCAKTGIKFGVGLSPFALYRDYSSAARSQLKDRIEQIQELGGGMLAILFDDMPGDVEDLAARQIDIVRDVQNWSPGTELLVCPTYYSFDPVLEKFFGDRPTGYWQALGEGLPAAVDIFWTGNEVCSKTITHPNVQEISKLLGRAPVLWDNYPVNDGEKASKYLHLRPLSGRDSGLESCLAGHFCNPMNQPWLSRAGIAGLAELYGNTEQSLESLYGEQLGKSLRRDICRLQDQGLAELDEDDKEQLRRHYISVEHPAAAELVAWLDNEYLFDPTCLTG